MPCFGYALSHLAKVPEYCFHNNCEEFQPVLNEPPPIPPPPRCINTILVTMGAWENKNCLLFVNQTLLKINEVCKKILVISDKNQFSYMYLQAFSHA